jgi:hypothetical protein
MYTGHLDKWDKIKNDDNSRNDFIRLYEKLLRVNGNELLVWINFLKYSLPNNNIQINDKYINQVNIDNMIHKQIKDAKTYPLGSKENDIDSYLQQTVRGAEIAEDIIEDVGGVKYSYVHALKHVDKERTVEEREHFLSTVSTKLFPHNNNNENNESDDENENEKEDDSSNITNVNSDSATSRGNEVTKLLLYNCFIFFLLLLNLYMFPFITIYVFLI